MPHDDRPRRRRAPRPWVTPDALPARPRPNIPSLLPSDPPPEMRATRSRAPEQRRTLRHKAQDLYRATGQTVRALPLEILNSVVRAGQASTEGDVDLAIKELTGVGVGRFAPRTDKERLGQAGMVALNAIPGGIAARRLAVTERGIARSLARREIERAIPGTGLAELERRAGLSRSAFERAGGRIGAGSSGALHALLTPARGSSLMQSIREGLAGPGFTIDQAGKPFAGTGYAVADPKLTRFIYVGDDPNAIGRWLASPKVRAALEQSDHYIGGWRDPNTGKIELNVTRILDDQRAAIDLARRNKQKAYGEFRDGQYVQDHEFITGASVRAVDGQWYEGLNHAEASEKAAAALRATPEGRALMMKNGQSAVIQSPENQGFRTSGGRDVNASSEEARTLAGPNAPAPQYKRVHSSDINRPPEDPGAAGARTIRPQGPPPPKEPHFGILRTSEKARRLGDYLLSDESAQLRNPAQFEAAGAALPSTEVFGAGAIAGAPKMGWYRNSSQALVETFGPEAPRFAALIAALSPQAPVSRNLGDALDLWERWTLAGSPTEPKKISSLLRRTLNIQPGSAWHDNAVSALTSTDPSGLSLSGPKVFNFHRNLIGETQRVTLDTWMQRLAGLKDGAFEGLYRGPQGKKVGVASPTYLAGSARTRETADYLKKLTGHEWTPDEVQETLWSWGKTLAEQGEVTPDLLRAAPDFATLMNEAPAAISIQRQGLPLPVPRSTIPPRLPDPEQSFLSVLTRNLNRSFKSERGALGTPGTLRLKPAILRKGKVYTGVNHGAAADFAMAGHSESVPARLRTRETEGFLTPDGDYVSREEAYRIATGDTPLHGESLASEHLDLPTQEIRDLEAGRAGLGNERGALGGKRTLLRVENERGQGPYSLYDRFPLDPDPTSGALDRQPFPTAPEWFGMDDLEQRDHQFGFRDVKQLKKWFTPYELQQLSELGFRVQPYEVDQHIYDRAQAIFRKDFARRAKATPLVPDADPMIAPLNAEGRGAIPMLLGSGATAGGALTLWEYLKGRR